MSIAKLWGGSSWSYPSYIYPKVWDGSAWTQAVSRVCTGGTSFESSATDSHVITIGRDYFIGSYGYNSISLPSYGSIDTAQTSLFTGGSIKSLYWSPYESYLYFVVDNPNLAYESWSNMRIGSTTFTRFSSFKSIVGYKYTYTWYAPSNPIGTSGNINIFWT
jgi:hypothetical protein